MSATQCARHGVCRDSFCQRCQDIVENGQLSADLDTVTAAYETVKAALHKSEERAAEAERRAEVMQHERDEYYGEWESTRALLTAAEARVQSASLLLDKCKCPALSTQIQLWQLETP